MAGFGSYCDNHRIVCRGFHRKLMVLLWASTAEMHGSLATEVASTFPSPRIHKYSSLCSYNSIYKLQFTVLIQLYIQTTVHCAHTTLYTNYSSLCSYNSIYKIQFSVLIQLYIQNTVHHARTIPYKILQILDT